MRSFRLEIVSVDRFPAFLRSSFAVLTAGLLFICGGGRLGAQTFYEKWHLTTASINEGDATFRDKWVGTDMLPYTADDEDLPEGGNTGGTWTAAWIDADGNGVFDSN